jgi:hypothetical protein
VQKGLSEAVEFKKTESLGDAEMPLTAKTEKRVRKKRRKENEATNKGEVETPAREVETPIEEVKLKKKERKRKNRDETDGAVLEKPEATTGDVKTVGDTGATKKRKRLEGEANEVQLKAAETTGDDGTPTEEQKAKKRKRKAGRDAPADQELNGEEEKKRSESLENGMNNDRVEMTVDGIEKKRKKRKKEKTQ